MVNDGFLGFRGFLGFLGFLGSLRFLGFLRISMVKHRFPWPFSGKNGPVYCVFTIIGALWEFSSGSTGSSGIEVNPSKMDPWFPTPGSRMTVVFYKTPSNNNFYLSRSFIFADPRERIDMEF